MRLGILRVLSARRSLSFFLAGVVGLAIWQVWLSWRLMEQDRNLELQRTRERLEQIADLAVAQLARTLGDWELGLRELNSLPPPPSLRAKLPAGATFIVVSHGSVTVYPRTPLLFVPEPPDADVQAPRVFDAAEELELRDQQYDRALAALQPLANEGATRSEALLRIARIERKAGRTEAALEAYKRLGAETALNPSGTPYALLAANARWRILAELGRREEASAEAKSIRTRLLEGRWPLRREAFEYTWTELDRLGLAAGQPPRSSFDFSLLVSELYDRWQGAIRAGSSSSGRDPRPDSSLAVWNATSERLSAIVTSPDWLNASLKLPTNSNDIRWTFLFPGAPAGTGISVTRSLAEAQLPGRLEFSSLPPAWGAAYRRRSLWLAGVGLMLMLVLASAYAIHFAASAKNFVWRDFSRTSWPLSHTSSVPRLRLYAPSPSFWRRTALRTSRAVGKAIYFSIAKPIGCIGWSRTFSTLAAWNRVASSTASRRTTLSSWSARPSLTSLKRPRPAASVWKLTWARVRPPFRPMKKPCGAPSETFSRMPSSTHPSAARFGWMAR